MKTVKKMTVALAAVLLGASTVHAAAITPEYDYFGGLPQATFNGTALDSGIPNESVTVSTGFGAIIGIEAHQRYVGPDLANDGAGTYYANSGPGLLPNLSTWNIAYHFEGSAETAGFTLDLLYDFDPAIGNDESTMGVIHFGMIGTGSVISGSQNLGFAFLDTGIPGIVIPPSYPSFDPNAVGEFSFAAVLYDGSHLEVQRTAFNVNTDDPESQPVPEPATIFGGAALAGIALRRMIRRKN